MRVWRKNDDHLTAVSERATQQLELFQFNFFATFVLASFFSFLYSVHSFCSARYVACYWSFPLYSGLCLSRIYTCLLISCPKRTCLSATREGSAFFKCLPNMFIFSAISLMLKLNILRYLFEKNLGLLSSCVINICIWGNIKIKLSERARYLIAFTTMIA